MNECIGILGELLGHSFTEYVISTRPSSKNFDPDKVTKDTLKLYMERDFKIICSRCGKVGVMK